MGDRGELQPFKADKYLWERGDREQDSQQQEQINTFSSTCMLVLYHLLNINCEFISHEEINIKVNLFVSVDSKYKTVDKLPPCY